MKKLLIITTIVLGAVAMAYSQTPVKLYTSPKLPLRDALERMNLIVAWNARVTVDGNRDGIASIQLIPGKPSQVVVQTYKGAVFLYDADNGDLVWKTNVGVPFWTPQGAGFNSHSIYVTRRNVLHVLNRADGAQRVFTYDPVSKHRSFGYELPYAPNAPLVADEEFVYVPVGDRVNAIAVPNFALLDKGSQLIEKAKKDLTKEEKDATPGGAAPENLDSEQPEFYWGFRFADILSNTSPLVWGGQLSILTTDGTLTSVSRYDTGSRTEYFDYKATGRSPGAPGQHQHMAYVASDDFNLYAISMKSGALIWRHVSGAPIRHKPEVNDHNVYIAPERLGLRRIDRHSGREVWTNRDATRFLAANLNHVYALDQVGKFYVLDARRGTTLAKIDLVDWAIPVANEWTDRIYLAANDGQVLCLRHRDLTKALTMKTLEIPKIKEEKKDPEEKKEEKEKEKEKEKDKEKDKDKDKDKDKEKDKDKDKDKDQDKDKEKAAAEFKQWMEQPRRIEIAAQWEPPGRDHDGWALRDRRMWVER